MCPPYWTVTLVSGAGAEGVPVAVTVGALRSSAPGVPRAPALPAPSAPGSSPRPRAPSPPPSPPPPRSLLPARVSGAMSPADAKRGAKRRKNKRGGGLGSSGGPGPSGGGGAGGLGKAGTAAGAVPLRAASQAAAGSPSAVGGLLTAPAAGSGALGGGGGAAAGHGEVRRGPPGYPHAPRAGAMRVGGRKGSREGGSSCHPPSPRCPSPVRGWGELGRGPRGLRGWERPRLLGLCGGRAARRPAESPRLRGPRLRPHLHGGAEGTGLGGAEIVEERAGSAELSPLGSGQLG